MLSLFELKINYVPGYRVYCGEEHKTTIIILCGGDKKSQSKDIERAKEHWSDYLNRRKNDE